MAAQWLKKVGQHLKGIAPMLVGAAGTVLGGPAAGGMLATIMREVTGAGENVDLDTIADEIFGSPELRYKLEELAVRREGQMQEAKLRELQIEEQMQKNVNATMQVEGKSDDAWQRRWRPFIGFVFGASLGIQSIGVTWILINGGNPELITSLQSLAFIWGPALAVLGVTSWGRSKEKVARVANGNGNA